LQIDCEGISIISLH